MEKATRAELIAALVTDKYSGFRNGDEAMLESASDVRLEEFRTASEANRTSATTLARMETDQRNTAARLKVAEERLVQAESTISDEDFIARLAPTSSIKELLESRAAEEKALHASLVSSLKNLGGESEEELKKKSVKDLQVLARYAGVKVLDFSGKGFPVTRSASEQQTSYAPPDPYKDAIEKHRAAERF
jgi:hypothetical protein